MAETIKELRAKIESQQHRINRLHCMLTRQPNETRRSGKIPGEDSRYTVKTWHFPVSGFCYSTLTHHHKGQTDCIIFEGETEELCKAYCGRHEDRERETIYNMAHESLRTFRKAYAQPDH